MRFKGENDWEGNRYLVNILLYLILAIAYRNKMSCVKMIKYMNMHNNTIRVRLFKSNWIRERQRMMLLVTDLEGPKTFEEEILGEDFTYMFWRWAVGV